MDNKAYFRSITDEINSLQNRVRNYIGDHWLSDGEWKESIIRAVLRRHLPLTVGIGNGFVVTTEKTSTQIDILLYDNTKPIVFREGDFVIVTPDSVRGMIEVKTTARKHELADIFSKLADNIEIIPCGQMDKRFFGVFFYESDFDGLDSALVANEILERLYTSTRQRSRRIINCVSIADSFFVRYWVAGPVPANRLNESWYAYNLDHTAPAYFAHNVIEHLCPEAVLTNNAVWYPEDGKEGYKIAQIPWRREHATINQPDERI
ncbi:MAG TPA: DUF6602 domain-containing protein [Verrucomicrobiae bacterium]|nr:DUF6602 domain-containing protein [Verrucomicrobiae bacterium]